MRKTIFRGLLPALLALLLPLVACVDPGDSVGSTSGTAFYVFDGIDTPNAVRIRVWDDANTIYASATAAPSRTISGTLLDKVKTLGWGGMCLDTSSNRLYLVSEAGDVVRIEKVRGQSGTLSSTQDIVTFALGSGSVDRLSNGKFGQAAVDPSTGTLYVTETGDSEARVWVVTTPSQYALNDVVARQTISVSGDKQGTGVAAWLGSVYAYFGDGNSVISTDLTQYSGPRLRKGNNSGFVTASFYPIIGGSTQLANYGALAFDSGNNQVYLARHLTDASTTGAPILVYPLGQFTIGLNQAPANTLGATGGYANLRILSHGGNKDWLAAATSNSGAPAGRIYLWRNPLSATTPSTIDLSGALVRGLAFDGSN